MITACLLAHETVNRDIERSIDVSLRHITSSAAPSTGDGGEVGARLRRAADGPDLQKAAAGSSAHGEWSDEGREREEAGTGGRSKALSQYRMMGKDSRESMLSSSMVVSPTSVDLSDVYVGEAAQSSFEVYNGGGVEMGFIVMNPSLKHAKGEAGSKESGKGTSKDSFKFSSQQGRLEAGGKAAITFSLVPDVTGRQSHQIIVRDITRNYDSTVTVSFTARKKGKESSSYVRIPDVDSDLLQFGDCYIAPKNRMHMERYIKTVPM